MERNRLNRLPRDSEEQRGERLEEAIAATGAVVREAGERDLDHEIDLARFGMLAEGTRNAMERMADASARYLGRSIVTDVFLDHLERREWRTKIIHDFGKESASVLEDNRLRLNMMTDVFMSASALDRALGREENKLPDVEAARQLLREIVTMGTPMQIFTLTYNSMEVEEKVAFVQQLSARLRDYLKLVAPKEPGIY